MTDRLAAVEYRILAPRATLLGPGDGDALANVIPDPLPSGCLVYVGDQLRYYKLDKTSVAPVAPPAVIATATGVGRWIRYGDGYDLIEDEGFPLPQRTTLNFVGPGVTAFDLGGKTVVSIPGGIGGFGPAPPDITDALGSAGVAGTASRSDHTHGHGDRGGGTLHALATTLVAGFMSAADKTKLDGLATTWRDPVANYAALPAVGNVTGDVRITLNTLAAYVWDGTRWMPLGLQDLSVGHQSYEDFDQTAVAADLNWTTTVAGAAAAVTNNAALVDTNHFGIRQLASGSTAAGRAGHYQSLNTRLLGGSRNYSEWLVQINTLSNAGQRYLYRVGLGDFWAVATSSPVQGVFFEYDDSVSPNWLLVNQRAAARTVVNSGIAVVAGAWVKLGLLVTDVPAQSEGFIAGASIGVNAGLLPNQVVGYGQRILKSVGGTTRSVYIDYFLQRTRFTTPR